MKNKQNENKNENLRRLENIAMEDRYIYATYT